MTSSPHRHFWIDTTTNAGSDLPAAPEPHLDVRCHRRLRGPYTGGGTLMRTVVPVLLEQNAGMVATRATEVVAIAPELADIVPRPPQTLTNLAVPGERTRFYPAARTLRISHGVAELLMDWARIHHPDGVVIALRDLDDADPTDRELASVLLRRCDPARLTVIVEAAGGTDDALGQALAAHAQRAAGRPPAIRPQPSPAADLAQLFIESEGTSKDPALLRAYDDLPPQERARRHTARAEELAARGEATLLLGAVPYHRQHGADPAGSGVEAIAEAVNGCFDQGFYDAVAELSERGRQVTFGTDRESTYWGFTHKLGACLSYIGRGEEAKAYFGEMRRGTVSPEVHMGASYLLAMLYTRHLEKSEHDENLALEWANTAIVIADQNPDPNERVFTGAFMRNARALVELHQGDLDGALKLVNEAIRMTDAHLGPDEQLLHRSVLRYNRAQIYAAQGLFAESLAEYDEVITRDPEYGDYFFERAAIRRAAGRPDDALADYADAIRLSPPFQEAHFNRADLLRDRGDDEGALRDLDYALELLPDHLDSLVNRADLLMSLGESDRARADVEHGLAADPVNANLLSAQGLLLAEAGDAPAARASFTAALRTDPDFVAAWANRAVLSYTAGRITEAVDDLDHAIGLSDDAGLRANRAIALQDLGDHKRALEDLDIAVAAMGDEDPDLLYRRGVSRLALHDTEGAHADWRAHLAAYGPGEESPFAAEIGLPDGEPSARAGNPARVATAAGQNS